jgi:transmembrane sensor
MALLNIHNDSSEIDILLAKYVTREADEHEFGAVEGWIAASEKNKAAAEQTWLIWEKSKGLGFNGSADTETAWDNFKERIKEIPVLTSGQKGFRLWLYGAAALLIGGIAVLILGQHPVKYAGPKTVKVFSGSRSRVDSLADGSVVTLYPHSSLSYDSPFVLNQRPVSLVGDAFFSVQPDARRPFRVGMGPLTVTVIGTRFSIASKAAATEISVYRGIVEVSRHDQRSTLHAHEKLIVPYGDSPWIKQGDSVTAHGRVEKNLPRHP